ncbi:MAG: hypothetical protein ACTTJC_08565 [Campylobacter sp.]
MRKIVSALLLLAATLGALEFTDQNGNKLRFDRSVKSVALFPVPLASFSLSVENNVSRLASVHLVAKKNIARGMLGKMIKSADSIPAGGIGEDFTPNIEELLKLSPDLVVQWGMRGEKIIEPLRKVGSNDSYACTSWRTVSASSFLLISQRKFLYHKFERFLYISALIASSKSHPRRFA